MRSCRIASLILVLAVSSSWAEPAPEETGVKLSEHEQQLLKLLNEARAREKLPPLRPNAILCKVARQHAANMARQEKMEHKLDGKKAPQRVEEAGYDYRLVGENVAFSEGDDEQTVPVEEVHQSWMKSEVHRANILKKDYEEVGLGIGRNAKGQLYYAQVFGTHRKKR
jgi:uncharacterized protein YkwD